MVLSPIFLQISKRINIVRSLTFLQQRKRFSSRLYIGGLSYGKNEEVLKKAFSAYGDILGVEVVVNRQTGRSKGFGFVNFANDEDADNAAQVMDGQCLDGRNIQVDVARPTQFVDYPKAVGPPSTVKKEEK